jgi:Flp pilus assembly protein TadG
MILGTLQRDRRTGATAVETAVVLLPLTICLFGLYECGRVLMDYQLLNNAAREGCRYALANNTSSTITSDVTTLVTGYMAGRDTADFTSSGQPGVTVQTGGIHYTTTGSTTITSATASSNQSALINTLAPGDMVTVTVSGTYSFMNIIPGLKLPTSFTLKSSCSMICEGGT